MGLSKLGNIHETVSGYDVDNLIFNEKKTKLLGKVQNADLPITPDGPRNWIRAVWLIDRENHRCIHEGGDERYHLNYTGKYMPPAVEEKPPKRNLYTFNKNGRGARYYKWVFGRNAWEVHPTMCPYFWIMVVVVPLFPIIWLVKLTGKKGQDFMESLRTFKQRREELREAKWIQMCKDLDKNPELIYKLTNTSDWNKYRFSLPTNLRYFFEEKSNEWESHLNEIKRKAKEEAARLQEIEDEKRRKILSEQAKVKAAKAQRVKEIKENKLTKIAGGLIFIMLSLMILYYTGIGLHKVYKVIRWDWVGLGLKWIAIVGSGCFTIYLIITYGLAPFFIWIQSKWMAIEWPEPKKKEKVVITKIATKRKLPDFKIMSRLDKIATFLFGWIAPVGKSFWRIGISVVDFGRMIKEMIYNKYKEECPTITWKDPETGEENQKVKFKSAK